MPHEILTNAQMARADALAIEAGTPGFTLMKNAGAAAAAEIKKRFKNRKALVLCGPGNNGGDGFVIAALLKKAGWNIRVASLVPVGQLKGDAAKAAKMWKGAISDFQSVRLPPPRPSSLSARTPSPHWGEAELVVDAVFGTGFQGRLKEPVVSLFKKIKKNRCAVAAIDIPSGVNGDTGAADKNALSAALTVTFCRKKLGHVLEPGKSLCGEIVVADIGIKDSVVRRAGCAALENGPELWRGFLPRKKAGGHKYDYGHAIIYGAPELTGATRLAAEACARIGAGLVTVLSPEKVANVYRRTLAPHVMVREDLKWDDRRVTARLYGPGGVAKGVRLKFDVPAVLDAGALRISPPFIPPLAGGKRSKGGAVVLTPHEGEFKRMFPKLKGSKPDRAKAAAKKSGCIVVLKGPDTVIADPGGRAVINVNAPPWLATAGTGDVLAGMITGLLAQEMEPFQAACAAVWMHGEAARLHGPGLVAGDMQRLIPGVLIDLA